MFTGTIDEWIDGNKFGFIRHDNPDFSRVFTHENEFAKPVNGERVGLRVEFEIGPPDDGSKIKSGSARNVKVVGRSKEVLAPSLEPDVREQGTVAFVNEERGYGFIVDNEGDKASRHHWDRVWFGTRAMQGEKFKTGERVEFIRMKKTLEGKGPAAAKVFKKGN